MFVDYPLLVVMCICTGVCLFLLICVFWTYYDSKFKEIEKRKRLKEERLLKIEEDIRYLKGIGGIENE